MYSMLSFGAVLVGSLGFVGAISPLSITGSKFFNAAGQQVFFKGSSFPLSVLYSFCLVPSVHYVSLSSSSVQCPVPGSCSKSNAVVCCDIVSGVLMVGIAYQRSPYDPFVNATQCQLDAALMKTLGANAIRSTLPF